MPCCFPPALNAVLFDFDGTLIDASEAIVRAFRITLDADDLPDGAIRSLIGKPLIQMLQQFRPLASPSQIAALVERYRNAFLPLAASHSRPLPGAIETLAFLRGKVHLAIVTTRMSDGAVQMLSAHDMLDAFDLVIGLEHVDHPKPHPQPILRALAILGVEARRSVMIGDTPDDMKAARDAETGAIGVTTGAFDTRALEKAGAHHVIASLTELDVLLRQPIEMAHRQRLEFSAP